MTHPQVKHSMVLVTYNHEKSVRTALDPITTQSVAPFELVILDDCSTDGTVAIVSDYLSSGRCQPGSRCRVVVNEVNPGIAKNMSKASQITQGNVTTIMSGDDLIAPGTVEAVDAAIRRQGLAPDSDRFVAFSPIIDRSPAGNRTIGYRIISDSPLKTMTRKTAPFLKVGFPPHCCGTQPIHMTAVFGRTGYGISTCVLRQIVIMKYPFPATFIR